MFSVGWKRQAYAFPCQLWRGYDVLGSWSQKIEKKGTESKQSFGIWLNLWQYASVLRSPWREKEELSAVLSRNCLVLWNFNSVLSLRSPTAARRQPPIFPIFFWKTLLAGWVFYMVDKTCKQKNIPCSLQKCQHLIWKNSFFCGSKAFIAGLQEERNRVMIKKQLKVFIKKEGTWELQNISTGFVGWTFSFPRRFSYPRGFDRKLTWTHFSSWLKVLSENLNLCIRGMAVIL